MSQGITCGHPGWYVPFKMWIHGEEITKANPLLGPMKMDRVSADVIQFGCLHPECLKLKLKCSHPGWYVISKYKIQTEESVNQHVLAIRPEYQTKVVGTATEIQCLSPGCNKIYSLGQQGVNMMDPGPEKPLNHN
jgi:hypothetical protein